MTLDDIQNMVGLQLGRAVVSPTDRLYEDLGAESMDLVNLAVAIEDRYHIFLPEEDLADLQTVRDVYDLVARYRESAS